MKKSIKKFFSRLVPKGQFKERLKLTYYNTVTGKDLTFLVSRDDTNYYVTRYKDLNFKTLDPLYNIVDDFEIYQHFHKVSTGDIVLDAGANNGYISLLFSKLVGPRGKVYAFEPDSINIKRIKENILLDSSLTNNIVIEDFLLWKDNTLVDFYEGGTVGSSAIWMPDDMHTVKKQAIRIDDWIAYNNVSKIDFIKMDIEGAEIEALDGCRETIKMFKPDFAIAAYHIVNGQPTYHKVEEFFQSIDYPYKTVKFKNEIITYAGKVLI